MRICAVFRAFDYDSSSRIDVNEFVAIGQAFRGADKFSIEDAKKCLSKIDKDKSGDIDINEFVQFFEATPEKHPVHGSDERFDALMSRYMAAAVDGRANHYVAKGVCPTQTSTPAKAECVIKAPESFVVKQEAVIKAEATQQSEHYIARQERQLKRRDFVLRAAKYNQEYASAERALVRQRRQARAAGNYFAEPDAKLLFVIRIRGMCDMHPKTKKILQLLRLRQIHLGVFLRANKATQEMIKRVEPYVAYGYPSLKAVRELIYKRGFGKQKTPGQAQRVALTDNLIIEKALGQHGIQCFEDLIHEIYTVGDHFKEANNFLWPFKLNSAKGGLPKKRNGFNEGGQCGNREQYISSLIFRML
jgi:large subunit ribosomal protein L7e